MNKILLVCYSFPPNPGVGGRRWAKFAKYLVKSGHYVEVINAKLTTDKLSTWSKDAQLLHEKNHVHSLPTSYPEIININPNKIKVIPNGFDPEDFSNIDTKKKQNSRINIVFTGSLYSKALTHLEALYKLLLGDKDLKQEFVFNFYGSIPKEAHYLFDNNALQSTLIFHGKV